MDFIGNGNGPQVKINVGYEPNRLNPNKLTGNIKFYIANNSDKPQTFIIADNSYGKGSQTKLLAAGGKVSVILDLSKSSNWYDFSIRLQGNDVFEERFSGRVETGAETKTDPLMGGIV